MARPGPDGGRTSPDRSVSRLFHQTFRHATVRYPDTYSDFPNNSMGATIFRPAAVEYRLVSYCFGNYPGTGPAEPPIGARAEASDTSGSMFADQLGAPPGQPPPPIGRNVRNVR